jgi:carboxyl-terminal processing protease
VKRECGSTGVRVFADNFATMILPPWYFLKRFAQSFSSTSLCANGLRSATIEVMIVPETEKVCEKPASATTEVPNRRCKRAHLRVRLGMNCTLALVWLAMTGCATRNAEPDFHLMAEAWNAIQNQYVDRSAVQPKEMTYGAISGMVESLGDTGHSTFLTPEMAKDLKNLERGEFKGVGLEIQMKDGHIVIVAPIDDSPAQKAGLRPGEIILEVAGQDITDLPLNRVVERITGKAGTKVALTLQDPHTGHTRQVTLVRAAIKLHEVTWYRLPGTSIAHVRLASFDAGVTRDLEKALTAIQKEELNGIVLDLRNNPGGLLDEAVGVASQFLASGNVLLAKDAKGQLEHVEVEPGGLATNLPVVVLINEGSASAAEIVAGALQDNHRAQLVGQTTFGTGTVLGEFKLSDGSALLLAIEEWLTPDGHSIWHKGIMPRFVVPLAPEADALLPATERQLTAAQLQASEDRQLLRALELLEDDKKLHGLKALKESSK